MDERILEFIGDLRRAEVRISPSEALDALAASAEVGLADRETFKSALAATLVKESRDLADLRPALRPLLPRPEGPRRGAAKASAPRTPGCRSCSTSSIGRREGLELDELTELLMRGQGSELEMAIRGRPERRARAPLVLPPGRLLLAPDLGPVRLVGHRARPREDHAAARGAGPRSRRSSPASATTWSCGWRRSGG